MRRLLAPDGYLLIVDWRADVEREYGPPAEDALAENEGLEILEAAGFKVTPLSDAGFPYHFVLLARHG